MKKTLAPLTYNEILEDWMITIAEDMLGDNPNDCLSETLAESAFIEFGDLHERMSESRVIRMATRAIRIAESNLGLE